MDVGNVERVNLMIKELTKHGRVDSFDDAVMQAQSTYSELPCAPSGGAISTETPVATAIDERKLNGMLRDKLGPILTAYNEGVMSEIDALKSQIEGLQNQLMTATPAQAHAEVEQAAPATLEAAPAKVETAKPEYNQKQGDWTSDDVCVEKMFYFGNK